MRKVVLIVLVCLLAVPLSWATDRQDYAATWEGWTYTYKHLFLSGVLFGLIQAESYVSTFESPSVILKKIVGFFPSPNDALPVLVSLMDSYYSLSEHRKDTFDVAVSATISAWAKSLAP